MVAGEGGAEQGNVVVLFCLCVLCGFGGLKVEFCEETENKAVQDREEHAEEHNRIEPACVDRPLVAHSPCLSLLKVLSHPCDSICVHYLSVTENYRLWALQRRNYALSVI